MSDTTDGSTGTTGNSLDEILNQLIDYVAVGKADMDRKKAKAGINKIIMKARIDELELVLKNCPMPTLSFEDIENRIAELKKYGRADND